MFDKTEILMKILSIPGILFACSLHEYAHALTAYKLGDDTPKFKGRLTLNPISHVDIIGFLMFLIVGFGWAKPVEINPNAFRNYRKDNLKVSIAGPLGNLIAAILSAIILSILTNFITIELRAMRILIIIIYISLNINILLFILNLIPIPGFDGFNIIDSLFPSFTNRLPRNLGTYSLLIFIAFLAPILPGGNSLLTYIVDIPADYIVHFITGVFRIRGF